ncbi:phenylacetate--CoA ligase family protein [Pararhizobium haloflavum]|uniref:phenylacetate--CoA ligase family protein n=1 Tax=Pararhizobium haloflavum TaxID=2037914 RepID=UPI000C1A72D7|nr:AMP-binding protein [Pararhizobium haloflavum]
MSDLYDERDSAAPGIRDAQNIARLRSLIEAAKTSQPFWAERLADIDPATIDSLDALAGLPPMRKSELPALQRAHPPFGGLNASAVGDLARLFMSPGPIFEPEGRGDDWWGAARALHAAGVRGGDIVLNTFSYHLTPAGAMFESGAQALGAAVIPAGPGNTADQIAMIEQFRPSAYVGTPDFLKILLDKAAESKADASSIRRALVSGAALPPSLAGEFERRGVIVRQCYGTADLGIVAYETGAAGMVVNEDVILEIVRAGTGQPVAAGEVGEVLVTRLNRDYPLFRFATGDLSCFVDSDDPSDRRTNRRIKGWLGRADQTTKVKGMFVRPEQIAAVAQSVDGAGRLRLVVRREGEQDVMVLRVEHGDPTIGAALSETLTTVTRLKGEVEIVPIGSLPNDGKVIADERRYD